MHPGFRGKTPSVFECQNIFRLQMSYGCNGVTILFFVEMGSSFALLMSFLLVETFALHCVAPGYAPYFN